VEENSEEYCYNSGDYYYSYGYFSGQVFVSGNHAYVPRQSYSESYENDNYVYRENLEFFIVDISDRTSPELVGRFEVEPSDYEGGEYFAGIIHTEKALLVGRTVYSNDSLLGRGNTKFFYDVIDLSSPTNLEVVERLEVPSLWAGGGWGYGMGGCMIDVGWGWWGGYGGSQNALVSGDIVASQHQEPLNDGTGRVRYYLDRIDVSDPESPVLMPKINIPGNVVHFDAAEARIVTIDYRVVTQPAFSWNDCYNGHTQAEFNESARTCKRYYRRLNVLDLEGDSAVLRSTRDIDSEVAAGTIAISQNRIF